MTESSPYLCCSLHYGAQLETSTYQHNTADYIYMYLFGMMTMNVRPALISAAISDRWH